ncbi:protein-glutamate methylesterase/protein-glutamine glutaminase [Limisalsivibrio acetivorans]|uniref:protein-glutamate methylesterase/protein-glutamine glutaminase n=1 Tax=Limisalsivibrio acetivorans TaxID=1304888 RepID=UPI0003B59F59|nr:chemotaxis response regulator protein-glutamate methylesterase [Limisalsivibrio acetivorans]
MSKVRVVVVDDSAFMRKAIESMIAKDPDIEIVGQARNGFEAVDMAKKLRPDVMTLDIEMPRMDGLTALQKIMEENPLPVIMVSSLTTEGADATIKALEYGAVDFISKDKSFASFGVMKIEDELRNKIKSFARRKGIIRRMPVRKPMRPSAPAAQRQPQAPSKPEATKTVSRGFGKKLVVIGTSTGGPQSLQKVIPRIPANFPCPIVIVQHMPPNFTKSLATRLDSLSKLKVIEAQGNEKLEPGTVYIAKGGNHLKLKRAGSGLLTGISSEPEGSLHVPSVDVTVESIANVAGTDTLGVIMTGMGSDGRKGLQMLKQRGGNVIAQDEESCIVYGMPRAVIEAGISDEIVPLDDIFNRIIFHCK